MVFCSPTFVFLFLPFVVIVYLALGREARNIALLTASLIFYAWGEGIYLLVLLGSIAMNHLFGLAIAPPPACSKRGYSPPYRTDRRQLELQAARRL
jgi:alginate O-acetyltransferase complex protein AlgI